MGNFGTMNLYGNYNYYKKEYEALVLLKDRVSPGQRNRWIFGIKVLEF